MRRSSIAIIGAGRLGSALALSLKVAGYPITEVVSRGPSSAARSFARLIGTEVRTNRTAALDADIIWFCVPDAQMTIAARQFSKGSWKGKIALHSSGVLTGDVLAVLKKQGVRVASVHPLMTFVKGHPPNLTGVSFAIEGDMAAVGVARGIVRKLGGKPIRIRARDKVAYHAFATMVCPLLISLLAASERAAALAGISRTDARRRMIPIIRQTIANYENMGAAKSFTGPIVRGDVETIQRHLDVLSAATDIRDIYTALVQSALRNLPNRNGKKIQKALMSLEPVVKPKAFNRKARKETRKVR